MENNRKPKVVFNFVEAGMGHIAPATAISDAFDKKYGDKCEVIRCKFFTEDNDKDLIAVQEGVVADTKKQATSKLHALFMEYGPKLIGGKLSRKVTDGHFRKGTIKGIEKIRNMQPDLVFNTYCFTGHYAVMARKKYNMDMIIGTYVPDPIVHEGWDREGDLFFACNSRAFKIANKKRHKDRVFQVPFAYRKEACEITLSKDEMRKKLGLPLDKFTILLCDGAYGQKNLKSFTEALIKLNEKITVISVCGKNTELFEYLKSIKDTANENVTFVPLGFVTNMLEYNCASDLFVGKGGANATCESYYFGNPVIVSSFANNLEKYTSDFYIKELKYGKIIFNKNKFIKEILNIIHNPDVLNEYRENLKAMHDNTGAEKIADVLFEELKKKFPNL